MQENYLIPRALLEWVLVYLNKQPHGEVHQAFQSLQQLKPAPKETPSKEKPTTPDLKVVDGKTVDPQSN